MEQTQIEQGVRLQKLIKALSLNQYRFAQSLGMTQPNISRMISGANKISAEVLNRIMQTYKQVNLHWLLTGEGEMYTAPLLEKAVQVNEPGERYLATGKGRLEDLEERLERLEEEVRRLKDEMGK